MEKLLNTFTSEKNGNINLLAVLKDNGIVQSKYLCKPHKLEELKIHLVLDTNHDFKIKGSGWERKLFNETSEQTPSNISIGLPDSIAHFFGDTGSGDYKVYVCLDAVTISESSRLGLFNTPIRWWDGGADSDHLVVPSSWFGSVAPDGGGGAGGGGAGGGGAGGGGAGGGGAGGGGAGGGGAGGGGGGAEEGAYSEEVELRNSQTNPEDITIQPPSDCIPPSAAAGSITMSPPRVQQKPPEKGGQISTKGQNASSVVRPLDWSINKKFMNIHNFYLPCVNFRDWKYDMILNLELNTFTLTLKSGDFKQTLSLNKNAQNPYVNCVSCTQVSKMIKLLTELYNKTKKSISLEDYINEMKKAEDTKPDYWNITNSLDDIYNFFSGILLGTVFPNVQNKNYTLLMLLLFFLFNLKRSGDQGQIEVVYLLQQAYPLKEFVFLTLDSHAAKIARDVYKVNVGLLSPDKSSFACYKRVPSITDGGGAGGGGAGGGGAGGGGAGGGGAGGGGVSSANLHAIDMAMKAGVDPELVSSLLMERMEQEAAAGSGGAGGGGGNGNRRTRKYRPRKTRKRNRKNRKN